MLKEYDNGKYIGEWKNGKKEGKGIHCWNDEKFKGDKYDGEWKNDKKEGKRIYCWNN